MQKDVPVGSWQEATLIAIDRWIDRLISGIRWRDVWHCLLGNSLRQLRGHQLSVSLYPGAPSWWHWTRLWCHHHWHFCYSAQLHVTRGQAVFLASSRLGAILLLEWPAVLHPTDSLTCISLTLKCFTRCSARVWHKSILLLLTYYTWSSICSDIELQFVSIVALITSKVFREVFKAATVSVWCVWSCYTSDLHWNLRPNLGSRWKIASVCVYVCVCVLRVRACVRVSWNLYIHCIVSCLHWWLTTWLHYLSIKAQHTHNTKVPAVPPHYFNIDNVMLCYRSNQVL